MTNRRKPTRKMAGVGVGGAVSVIIVWIVSLFGITVPVEVASAASVLVSFAVGYFVKDS